MTLRERSEQEPTTPLDDARQIERCVQWACLLEATARKPGNVHPQASFLDLTYHDFVRSAEAIAPVLAQARSNGVGRSILEAVARTREAVGRNTNLGIILLLAPLAAAARPLAMGIVDVLDSLNEDDARQVYQAIRLAQPGGMGRVSEADVSQDPTGSLVEMMRLAAGRDAIAAQYANGFSLVFEVGLPLLVQHPPQGTDWEQAVIRLQLHLMAHHPDTLIARKCGAETARQSAERARDVLEAGWPHSTESQQKIAAFDHWLRADGNRRNPGTTADLVTACLFAALREQQFFLIPAIEQTILDCAADAQ